MNHLVLVLSVPGEHGGVEQESRVKSTPRTHVSMVLCLTLRETAITQLNTRQRRAAPLWSQSTEGTAVKRAPPPLQRNLNGRFGWDDLDGTAPAVRILERGRALLSSRT